MVQTIGSDHDAAGVFQTLESKYKSALSRLLECYYNPHKDMANVLEYLYNEDKLSYKKFEDSNKDYLTRAEGSCHFCVNDPWKFPLGCPYGKIKENVSAHRILAKSYTKVAAASSETEI